MKQSLFIIFQCLLAIIFMMTGMFLLFFAIGLLFNFYYLAQFIFTEGFDAVTLKGLKKVFYDDVFRACFFSIFIGLPCSFYPIRYICRHKTTAWEAIGSNE